MGPWRRSGAGSQELVEVAPESEVKQVTGDNAISRRGAPGEGS